MKSDTSNESKILMKRFMASLTRTTDEFSRESDTIRTTGTTLSSKYGTLQHIVKKSLVKRTSQSSMSNQNSHPYPVKRSGALQKTFGSDDQPPPSIIPEAPLRSTAFHAKPTTAAKLAYDPPGKQRMYEEIIEGYYDYLQNPTPAGSQMYDGQVDPFLHVGTFEESDYNWNLKNRPPF